MMDGRPTLAWETVVTGAQQDGTPSERHVVTDAATGKRPGERRTGELRPGQRPVQRAASRSAPPLRPTAPTRLIDPERGGHQTLDSSVDARGVLFTDDDDVWGDGTPADRQTAAVDAAYGARMTWDFFKDRFGRNGIADDGRGSTSRVHYEQSRGSLSPTPTGTTAASA